MTTTQDPLLTRKDISRMCGGKLSVWMIAKHEKRWGLDKARIRLSTRMVLYNGQKVSAILEAMGVR